MTDGTADEVAEDYGASPVPDDMSLEDFHAGLLHYAKLAALLPVEAAVRLLIAHGHWTSSRSLRNWCNYWPETGSIRVRWKEAVAAIDGDELTATISEFQVLLCACGLAGAGRWSLHHMIDSLGFADLELVMQAMAHSRGWHQARHDLAIEPDDTTGGRQQRWRHVQSKRYGIEATINGRLEPAD